MKILAIILLTFLFTWDSGQGLAPVHAHGTNTMDSVYRDTILVFHNLKPSTAKKMTRLTEDIVKLNLYKYYKERDCFIEDDYPSSLGDKDYDKNTVRYNLSYFVNLNNDRFTDAIVEYWLMPPGASGHCYQPHKAMIVSGAKEYVLVNPDFVDSFFSIDSVKSANNKTFIFGCDYDCGGSDKCKRRMRAVIQ